MSPVSRPTMPGVHRACNAGMTSNDISIVRTSDSNNCLVISGKRATPASGGDDKVAEVRMMERFFGEFERTVCLPGSADLDSVDASVSNGVLTVEIAQRTPSEPKLQSIRIR